MPMTRLGAIAAAVRRAVAETSEANERLRLLNRPWEEELLHWAPREGTHVLHGTLTPPNDGRRRSVTPSGWCPGHSVDASTHGVTEKG